MKYVLRIDGLASGTSATEHDGRLLKAYDPDRNLYAGYIESTTDPAEALKFAGMAEAMAVWMRVSMTQPTRPDGLPNRPLSAFTCQFEPIDE